jgi:hypothetical protein
MSICNLPICSYKTDVSSVFSFLVSESCSNTKFAPAKNDFFQSLICVGCRVSPQLTPSCNNIIDLRPLSKIKYTHDEGNRNAKTLR